MAQGLGAKGDKHDLYIYPYIAKTKENQKSNLINVKPKIKKGKGYLQHIVSVVNTHTWATYISTSIESTIDLFLKLEGRDMTNTSTKTSEWSDIGAT